MSTPFAVGDLRLAGPALLAFTEIAKAWSLTEVEQFAILGKPQDLALVELKAGLVDGIQSDMLQRVSYVLGVYRALHTIFPDEQQADSWVRRPNTAALFKGAPAIALMCSGRLDELAVVRHYLEDQGLADI